KASAATVKVDRSWRCIVPLYSGFLAGLPKSRVFYGPSSPLLAHRRRSSEDVSDGAIEAAWGAVRAGNAEVAAGATHYACPDGLTALTGMACGASRSMQITALARNNGET